MCKKMYKKMNEWVDSNMLWSIFKECYNYYLTLQKTKTYIWKPRTEQT